MTTWTQRADQKPEGNLRRALMGSDLNRLSALFQETGNVAAAWLCWHLAQRWQMPAPQPVADEINRFAEQIAVLAIEALDGNAYAVIDANTVAALWDTSPSGAKDGTRRGSTGLAEQIRIWDRDFKVALRVYELRSEGLTNEEACEAVAKEMGVGEHNADRIAKRYRKGFLADEAEAKKLDG